MLCSACLLDSSKHASGEAPHQIVWLSPNADMVLSLRDRPSAVRPISHRQPALPVLFSVRSMSCAAHTLTKACWLHRASNEKKEAYGGYPFRFQPVSSPRAPHSPTPTFHVDGAQVTAGPFVDVSDAQALLRRSGPELNVCMDSTLHCDLFQVRGTFPRARPKPGSWFERHCTPDRVR